MPRQTDSNSDLELLECIKVKRPRRYRVLMHNDDYTTMDFVILMLRLYFDKGPAEAEQIMWDVHRKGVGVCGVYTKEIAETRISLVHYHAREMQYPLKCSMEPIGEEE